MEYVKYLIEFLILFLLAYFYYRFIAIKELRPKRKNKKEKEIKQKKKKKDSIFKLYAKNVKDLPEIRLLILSYKIDEEKINYVKLGKAMALILSFNLALTVVLTLELFDNILLKVLVGIVTLLFTMLTSYRLVGIYYKKKGMTKNV